MTGELLQEHFPLSPMIGAVHSNTDNVHASLYIGARQTNGRKLDLGRDYLRIDETWNRIYCEATGRDPKEHMAKKAESAQFHALVRTIHREARRQRRPVTWQLAEKMGEALTKRPRPERFADYRAIPIHPDAQHAATLAREVLRMEALDRIIEADRASPAAEAARAELRTFGDQGSVRRRRQDLATIMVVMGESTDLLAQIRRLAGAEPFARAEELRRTREQTMVREGFHPGGRSRQGSDRGHR
jgi:hypothetical protein